MARRQSSAAHQQIAKNERAGCSSLTFTTTTQIPSLPPYKPFVRRDETRQLWLPIFDVCERAFQFALFPPTHNLHSTPCQLFLLRGGKRDLRLPVSPGPRRIPPSPGGCSHGLGAAHAGCRSLARLLLVVRCVTGSPDQIVRHFPGSFRPERSDLLARGSLLLLEGLCTGLFLGDRKKGKVRHFQGDSIKVWTSASGQLKERCHSPKLCVTTPFNETFMQRSPICCA